MTKTRHALITGSAGFIGFHLTHRLLKAGWVVTGFDGMTDYYDVALKEARHAVLSQYPTFTPAIAHLENRDAVLGITDQCKPDVIVHLAAQAGVRYSIEAPQTYLDANIQGSFHILEAAKTHDVPHVLMASTSSAYGANEQMPYMETQRADHQMSIYAATKKAMENLSHAWAHIHSIPVTCFRFFTVYGPWGRPDMALFKFTRAILGEQPIEVYNRGEMWRDFTYIDDLITGIVGLIDAPLPGKHPVSDHDSLSPVAPWRVVNIGNGTSVKLTDFIAALEMALGRKAELRLMPMQPGDVPATWANASLLQDLTGSTPTTPMQEGVARFVQWYRDFYDV